MVGLFCFAGRGKELVCFRVAKSELKLGNASLPSISIVGESFIFVVEGWGLTLCGVIRVKVLTGVTLWVPAAGFGLCFFCTISLAAAGQYLFLFDCQVVRL